MRKKAAAIDSSANSVEDPNFMELSTRRHCTTAPCVTEPFKKGHEDVTPSKRDIFRGQFGDDVFGSGTAPCSEERVEGRASSRPGEVRWWVVATLLPSLFR